MKNTKSLVIKWGTAVAGRENIGLELFMGVTQYYDGLVKEDKLGSAQSILFENGNFEEVSGMMVLTGSDDQIQAIADSEKHRENVTKAAHVANNVSMSTGTTNVAIPERVQNLMKWRKELGL